ALEGGERRLVAERTHRAADTLERARDVRHRTEPGGRRELAPEQLSSPTKSDLATLGRELVGEGADEVVDMARRELDRLQLRRHSVDLRRSPGSRAVATGPPLVRHLQEPRRSESVEPRSGDIPVHAELEGRLVGGDRADVAARDEERGPDVGV